MSSINNSELTIDDIMDLLDHDDPFLSIGGVGNNGAYKEINLIPSSTKSDCKKFLLVDLRHEEPIALKYLVESYNVISDCSKELDEHYTIYMVNDLDDDHNYVFFKRIVAGLSNFRSNIFFKVKGQKGLRNI